MKAICVDCSEFVLGINMYLYEAHHKPILCKPCIKRRQLCCGWCNQLLNDRPDGGFFSDVEQRIICYECNKKRMNTFSKINKVFYPDEGCVKLIQEITQEIDPVPKELGQLDQEISNIKNNIKLIEDMNNKLRNLFNDEQ